MSEKWHLKSSQLDFRFSFWVVTWLGCDNFEFEAKICQNWPKMAEKAPNHQKWPECLKSDWNWLIWCCHSYYRPILSACANFIQQWGWTGQKTHFWQREIFLMEWHQWSYFIIFIHPNAKYLRAKLRISAFFPLSNFRKRQITLYSPCRSVGWLVGWRHH